MTSSGSTKTKSGLAARMLVGAVFGAAATGLALVLLQGLVRKSHDPGTMLGLAAGLSYIFIGLLVGLGTLAPAAGARFLNVEDAEEIIEQRPSIGPGAIATVLIGLFLLILAFAPALTASVNPAFLALAALGCLAGAILIGFITRGRADELSRQVSLEASALALHISLVVVGVWAALARLGYAGWTSPLGLVSGLALLELVAIFWILGKRGLMRIRQP